MIVRADQCRVPKCKGCDMHIGHPHAEGCILVLAEAVRSKRRK
jgi:hypothetical protein